MTVKKPLIHPCTLDLLGLPLGVLAESPWPNQFVTAMFFLCYLWLHHFPSLRWPHVSWETTIQTLQRSQECWWNIPTTITMVEYVWISLPTFFSPNLVCNPTQSLEADTCYSSTRVWKSVAFCTWQKMLKIYDRTAQRFINGGVFVLLDSWSFWVFQPTVKGFPCTPCQEDSEESQAQQFQRHCRL